MSRRMQLVNLSLISVGDKQINPGLTSFVHIVAQLDLIKLPCAKPAGSKTKLQCVIQH